MSKYDVPDGHWETDNTKPDKGERTTVNSHEIDVVYEVEPDHDRRDMGYGREKYTAMVSYADDERGVHVLYVVEHRWKGNYWRDVRDWEFSDIPDPVRKRVAAVLPVDGPAALDTDVRIVDEGGESRFEKIHKPRMESYQGGGHMWGETHLKDAVKQLDGAAEAIEDKEACDRIEELRDDIQDFAESLRQA